MTKEELEKENAELKKELVEKGQHLDLTEKEWGKDLVQMYHFKNLYTKQTDQLTKAIEILKKYHNECPSKYSFEDIDNMAEQFLSEVEKEKDKEKPEVQRREISFNHRVQNYVGE